MHIVKFTSSCRYNNCIIDYYISIIIRFDLAWVQDADITPVHQRFETNVLRETSPNSNVLDSFPSNGDNGG